MIRVLHICKDIDSAIKEFEKFAVRVKNYPDVEVFPLSRLVRGQGIEHKFDAFVEVDKIRGMNFSKVVIDEAIHLDPYVEGELKTQLLRSKVLNTWEVV